jgi:hypothetical protein
MRLGVAYQISTISPLLRDAAAGQPTYAAAVGATAARARARSLLEEAGRIVRPPGSTGHRRLRPRPAGGRDAGSRLPRPMTYDLSSAVAARPGPRPYAAPAG